MAKFLRKFGIFACETLHFWTKSAHILLNFGPNRQIFSQIFFQNWPKFYPNQKFFDQNWTFFGQNRSIFDKRDQFSTKLDKIISHIKMPLVLLPVTLIILARKIIEISVIENVKLREMKNFSTLIMKSWRLFSRRIQIHQKIIPDLESSGMFMIDQIQLHHHHQTVSHSIYHTLPYQRTSTIYYINPPHRPTTPTQPARQP